MPDELYGWKMIAAHIEVTEKTARRYYREHGLPVRKHGGRYRASRRELDRWLRAGIGEARGNHADPRAVPVASFHPPSTGRFNRPAISSILSKRVAPLCLVGLALWLSPLPRAVKVASVSLVHTSLVALDRSGRLIQRIELPGLDPTAYSDAIAPMARDVDGDGADEILLNFHPDPRLQQAGRLICYDARGTVRWTFSYEHALTVGRRSFSKLFYGHHLRWIDRPKNPLILVITRHIHWYPSRVMLLNPEDGRLEAEYWHPGFLETVTLVDLDGDGSEELIVGGVNNPDEGTGYPALAVLDVPFQRQLPATANFFGPSNAFERHYLLFPKQDFLEARHRLGVVTDVFATESRLWVSVSSGDESLLVYELDHSLMVRGVQPSDTTLHRHDVLHAEGLLDHSLGERDRRAWRTVARFPSAPNGNGPVPAAAFARRLGIE